MKKITKFILVIGSVIVIIFVVSWYMNFQVKARESYVEMVGKSIHLAEQSYHQEWKRYSGSLKDIGFNTNLKDIKIYTAKEEVPEVELKKVPPRDYPHFETNTYKMILRWRSKDTGLETLWVLDETGTARKIEN